MISEEVISIYSSLGKGTIETFNVAQKINNLFFEWINLKKNVHRKSLKEYEKRSYLLIKF